MTMPALTTATRTGPDGPVRGRQWIEGRVVEISMEPPCHGAIAVVWVRTVSDSSSILDVRGLVVWPGTALVAAGEVWWRPDGPGGLQEGDRLRACATEEEYWSIPPIFDATRIEIIGRG